MATHHLKTDSEYLKDIIKQTKRFEYRLNDRDYQKGDVLKLYEIFSDGTFGKKLAEVLVQYVLFLSEFHKDDNKYCVMGIALLYYTRRNFDIKAVDDGK